MQGEKEGVIGLFYVKLNRYKETLTNSSRLASIKLFSNAAEQAEHKQEQLSNPIICDFLAESAG